MVETDWNLVGRRVATRRERLGLSIRQLSTKAKVDKNTVLRLERGQPVRAGSATRICSALGTALERQMLPTGEPEDPYKVSRSNKRVWTFSTDSFTGPAPSRAETRWRLGWEKVDTSFCELIDSELFDGSMTPAIAEVFGATKMQCHKGEEFIFCLRGQLVVHVGEEAVQLGPGDALTFKSSANHWFSPGQSVQTGQPPPMFLSVQVLAKRH